MDIEDGLPLEVHRFQGSGHLLPGQVLGHRALALLGEEMGVKLRCHVQRASVICSKAGVSSSSPPLAPPSSPVGWSAADLRPQNRCSHRPDLRSRSARARHHSTSSPVGWPTAEPRPQNSSSHLSCPARLVCTD